MNEKTSSVKSKFNINKDKANKLFIMRKSKVKVN